MKNRFASPSHRTRLSSANGDDGPGAMEKRRRERSKQRLVCELLVEGNRHPAIVRDLSRAGLFVQTRARPEPNSVVEVIFPAEGDAKPEIRVEAGVARLRSVATRLQHSVPAGVGLEVLDPPPAFLELVKAQKADSHDLEPTPGGSPQPLRTFRVRLTRDGAPGSKVLTVGCENAAGARARALTRAGRGWKIAEIQEI